MNFIIIIVNLTLLSAFNYTYYIFVKENKTITKNIVIENMIKNNEIKIKNNFNNGNILNINAIIDNLMQNNEIAKINFNYILNDGTLKKIETPPNFLDHNKNIVIPYEKDKTKQQKYSLEVMYGQKITINDLKNQLIIPLSISILYFLFVLSFLYFISKKISFFNKIDEKLKKIDMKNISEIYIPNEYLSEKNQLINVFNNINLIINEVIKKQEIINNKEYLIKNLRKKMKIWFLEVDKNKNIKKSFGFEDLLPKVNKKDVVIEDLFNLIESKVKKMKIMKKFKDDVQNEIDIDIDIEIFVNMTTKHLNINGHYNYKKETYIFMVEDKTPEIKHQEELYKVKNIDFITGLRNFNNFEEHTLEVLKHKSKYAFINININDIDNLSKIYNSFVSEDIIRNISFGLKDIISNKFIFKYSEDTFFIVFEFIEEIKLKNFLSKISNVISVEIETNDKTIYSNYNIGYSTFVYDEKNKVKIIDYFKESSIALMESIELNKKSIEYSKKLFEKHVTEFEIYQELKNTLVHKKDDLNIFFQPKSNIETKKYESVEALIRWNNNTLGNIKPDKLISVAMKYNLMDMIDDFVFNQVFNVLKTWKMKKFKNIKLSINVIGEQINIEFVNKIKNLLLIYKVDAKFIELEINGNLNNKNNKEMVDILQKLQNLGLSIVIDNFGTNTSSLLYLKLFPFNIIKIDKSFIKNIEKSENDLKIAKEIIKIGKNHNFKIYANGVETKKQLDILTELKVDTVQGFYFSEALSIEDLENFLLTSDY